MKRVIRTNDAPEPIGPYNQAIMVDNILFVSGQIPMNPTTNKLEEGIEAQTEMVMKNIKAILTEAGMGFANVVKCTIFLSDMNNFAIVNRIYGEYFDFEPPAREAVEVAKLPLNVDVEISCIATANL